MTQEIKEWAHKEFDEKYGNAQTESNCSPDKVLIGILLSDFKSFIDSLIDRTVQKTEERIVGVIGDLKSELHESGHHIRRQALDDIISLITNKSDINSGMPHPFTNPEAVYGSNINKLTE